MVGIHMIGRLAAAAALAGRLRPARSVPTGAQPASGSGVQQVAGVATATEAMMHGMGLHDWGSNVGVPRILK